MNRSIILIGVGILLFGFILIAFPIAVTGQEQFDIEQEAGIYFIPPALAVLLVGSISEDPRTTTVAGTLGNPDLKVGRTSPARPTTPAARGLGYNPRESANCRYCYSMIPFDLARCPRCARARECRTCHRPLGSVLDRATCPTCARPEALCNCRVLPARPPATVARSRRA
jgi:hypothetical protein